MKPLTRCKLALAVGLSALALAAQAQQPTATTPAKNAPAAQSSNGGTQPAHAKTKHATHTRAPAHHAMRHGNQATADNETTNADSAYKSALRQCVTGPQSSRDSCLDQAIARYGHA